MTDATRCATWTGSQLGSKSLAFVGSKHAIVAYDENDQLWTRAFATEYLSELMA